MAHPVPADGAARLPLAARKFAFAGGWSSG